VSRIIVIGAGIVGVSTALYLQRDGHEITIIDRQGPGEGTSKGNAGLIAIGHAMPVGTPGTLAQVPRMLLDPTSPLAVRWGYAAQIAPWLFRFVRASTPARVEAIAHALAAILKLSVDAFQPLLKAADAQDLLQHRGLLYVYETREGFEGARAGFEHRKRLGIRVEYLAEPEAKQLAPALGVPIQHGVYMPDVQHCIDPYRLTRALAESFVRAGGRILQEEVVDFRRVGDGPDGVVTRNATHNCDGVVLAAGAWSRALLRKLDHDAPLDTERGYHVMLENQVGLRLPVSAGEGYFSISPMAEGIRLGGTVEFGGLDLPPNPRRWDVMEARARRLFPGLTQARRSTWMGFRPSMPDSLPVIGRARRTPRLICALGHGHLGLTLGPITGRLLADELAGRAPILPRAPYALERFAR
jgi:D-amino-acid dehydrogenase